MIRLGCGRVFCSAALIVWLLGFGLQARAQDGASLPGLPVPPRETAAQLPDIPAPQPTPPPQTPPPGGSAEDRLRALEQQNMRLAAELAELRSQISGAGPPLGVPLSNPGPGIIREAPLGNLQGGSAAPSSPAAT
ncbi:MAG TPA: hypothetical protein VH092_25830 [Urbifossiella sp.]|jgi:hypothetical protein|nr:hypothetical protein [Urbifossiella sp.]